MNKKCESEHNSIEHVVVVVVRVGRVALVLLTEAHVAMPVALCHAGVVHHEEVDLEVVSACSPDLIVL